MISIRNIDYTTDEAPDKVFSRLTWAVERVDGLLGQLISNMTVETNRPWIGVYDHETMKFGLMEPRGFLSMRFFQIVVRGQVTRVQSQTVVNIKFRLGWHTILLFLMLYFATAMLIGEAINNGGALKEMAGLILWILVFPVLGTMLLHRKLNRIELKVEDLFGFG